MSATGFALFDTAIGACALAWNDRGIVGVNLPETTPAALRARMKRRFPGAAEAEPPDAAQDAIARIVALMAGEPADLAPVRLDMEGVGDFDRRVYDVARGIPPGATLTYGEIAQAICEPGVAREVGQSLGRNPFPIVVPCHRVLAAGGKVGGFSAHGSIATKRRMLAIEAEAAGPPLPLFAAKPG